MAFSKVKLSGSTNGRGVKVVATGSPGTDIHTAHASNLDEIWIWAYNGHTAPVVLTLQHGGTTTPDDDIKITIPHLSGAILIVPGWLLTNSLLLKAYAATANVITLHGFVNRIS